MRPIILTASGLIIICLGIALAQTPKAGIPFPTSIERTHPAPIVWEKLAEGFDRTILGYKGHYVDTDPVRKVVARNIEMVVYRIDTAIYPVRVVTALEIFYQKKANLTNVHKKLGAVLTINGGFFSHEGDPMGLVISNGKIYGKFDEEGGSGALAVYGDILRIGWAANVVESIPPPDHALQNGPLLIEPGGAFGMQNVREKYYARTVVGLDRDGKMLVGVIRKPGGVDKMALGLNLYETAIAFYNPEESGGLDAVAAINLDGGTSTGMEINLGEHSERIRVYIHLPNFVCIMPPEENGP